MEKVYVAGSSKELLLCRNYMVRLREAGFSVTQDWTQTEGIDTAANPDSPAIRMKHSILDLEGIESADLFWLLVPTAPHVSRGAFVELGFVICKRGIKFPTNRMTIVASGDYNGCIFTSLADRLFTTHEAAFRWIVENKRML